MCRNKQTVLGAGLLGACLGIIVALLISSPLFLVLLAAACGVGAVLLLK